MQQQKNKSAAEPVMFLGELHPLIEQLGATDGLVTLDAASATLQLGKVNSVPALRSFLDAYRLRLLVPIELPAIARARQHAERNELRELITLDQELARDARLLEFASASRRVGSSQLKRLRPLRDLRLVQRYLHAVENGQAGGWHTLVYGITLAVYSLPVRQGLLNYGEQTLAGFLNAASRPLQLTETTRRDLLQEYCAALPTAVEQTIGALPQPAGTVVVKF